MRDRSNGFAALVDEHYEPAVRALTVAFRDPALAERSTADAFSRELARRRRRDPQPPASIYVAASRAALRQRSAHGNPPTPITTPPRPPSEPGALVRAIEALPLRERLALVLHHHAGLSPDEIARALDCSRPAANATLREAYRRLGIEQDDDADIPEVDLDEP